MGGFWINLLGGITEEDHLKALAEQEEKVKARQARATRIVERQQELALVAKQQELEAKRDGQMFAAQLQDTVDKRKAQDLAATMRAAQEMPATRADLTASQGPNGFQGTYVQSYDAKEAAKADLTRAKAELKRAEAAVRLAEAEAVRAEADAIRERAKRGDTDISPKKEW